MEQLIHYVLGELRVIARAPIVFAAALLILGSGIWWALDWRYSGIIANRDSEISSLQIQRDEYKDKLSGASPEQAAQRIAALEAKVKDLEPKPQRHLTDEQKQQLVKGLKSLAPDIQQIYIFAEAAREPTRFAAEFLQVFKEAGINPLGPISTIPNYVDETGILVGLLDPAQPSDLAKKYMDVLRSADLKIGTTKWQGGAPINGKVDFDLYVCGY
jgi:hypothetical protein